MWKEIFNLSGFLYVCSIIYGLFRVFLEDFVFRIILILTATDNYLFLMGVIGLLFTLVATPIFLGHKFSNLSSKQFLISSGIAIAFSIFITSILNNSVKALLSVGSDFTIALLQMFGPHFTTVFPYLFCPNLNSLHGNTICFFNDFHGAFAILLAIGFVYIFLELGKYISLKRQNQ